MGITKLSFFNYIKKKDIITLLKYVEKQGGIREEWENDTIFLYKYYQQLLGSDFEPVTILQYIYLFVPKKYSKISTITLNGSIQELRAAVIKHEEAYQVHSIGNHYMFEVLEEIEGFNLVKTRSEVWIEALNMQNFLEIYRFWSPSWERMRAVGKFSTPEIIYTMELRRIGSRVIIIEAKEKNGVPVQGKAIMRMQRAINLKLKEMRKRQRENCLNIN